MTPTFKKCPLAKNARDSALPLVYFLAVSFLLFFFAGFFTAAFFAMFLDPLP